MDYTSIKVGQLPSAAIAGTNLIPHEVDGLLKKATITDLAAFISANGAVGFRAVSVPNGGTLPSTTQQEFILVGPGTYNNVGGGSPVTVTEELNALVSNGTFWFIGVQIPIDAAAGGTANWGGITGTLSAQTDLQTALNGKQNSSADLSSIAALTGTTGLLRKTAANTYSLDTNTYALDSSLSGYLPLSGGTLASSGSTNTLNINHSSGSGVAASITKGGNGEALTVVKSSGSGNAASITGGVTLLSELNLTTKLADAHINSAATWNAKQNALNGTGFVKISGTTISYDNNTYALDSEVVKLTGTQTIGGAKTFENGIRFDSDLHLKQDNIISTPSGYTTFSGTSTGFWFHNGASRQAVFSLANTSTLRTYELPNKDGTFAMLSDITGGSTEPLEFNTTDRTVWNNGKGNVASNTSFGDNALKSNTTGAVSSAYGNAALMTNTTGQANSGFGNFSLGENLTGFNNTGLGYYSLAFNSSGSGNIAVGVNSGAYLPSSGVNAISNQSVFLGTDTRPLANNQTNQIVIGFDAIGHGSNSVTLGNSSIEKTILRGNVGIGTANPGVSLEVNGLIRAIPIYSNTTSTAANMVISAGGTFERSTSSIRYKRDVLDYDRGLNYIMQMRPVYYKGKSKNDGDKQFAGLIAEEIHDLGLEEFVQYNEEDLPDALSYANMVCLLVKGIQELKSEIELLKQ
jgi:hypothetical protein